MPTKKMNVNTKKKILQLAMQLIQQHGFSGWSFETIAQKIGIKKASIHYYFPKKTDLVLATVKDYIAALQESLVSIAESNLPASKKLFALSKIYREVFREKDRLCLCLILSQNFVSLPRETHQELRNHYKRLRKLIQDTIQDGIITGEFSKTGISAKGAAELFLAALQGLLVLGFYGTTQTHFDLSIAHFIGSLT